MKTLMIRGILDASINGLQNAKAKRFRSALEQQAEAYGGKMEDFYVDSGIVTITIDNDEAAGKLEAEFKGKGKDITVCNPLDAFFEMSAKKKSKTTTPTE